MIKFFETFKYMQNLKKLNIDFNSLNLDDNMLIKFINEFKF